MKKYIELTLDNQTLRGFHHQNNNKKVMIMLHGFTGNKSENQQLFRTISDMIEPIGYDSIRLDYLGHGESDGNFIDLHLDSLNKQVQTIKEFAISLNYQEINILGFSMGGMLALLNLDPIFKKAILISPAVKLERIASRYTLYSKEKSTVQVGGLELSTAFFDSLQSMEILKHKDTFKNPMLFIQGEKDVTVLKEDVIKVSQSFDDNKVVIVKGADHIYSSIDARKKVYNTIREFLS